MGSIHPDIPQELVARLRKELGIATLIDTGTHNGATAAWASAHFSKVITIESNEFWFDQTKERLVPLGNVTVLLGHSAQVLPEFAGELTRPAIFWLDAH